MTGTIAGHPFERPPAGHPDPHACMRCGYGADATQHPLPSADARIDAAARLGGALRAELAALVGQYPSDVLALVDGRVAQILAVLEGAPAVPFLVAGRVGPAFEDAA